MEIEILSVLLSADVHSVAEVGSLLHLSAATGIGIRRFQHQLRAKGSWICILIPRMCK